MAAFTKGKHSYKNEYNISRYHKDTHETVAIKVIDLDYAEDDVDDIMKEIAILAQMNSKYVTRFIRMYAVTDVDTLGRISKARNSGL